MINGRCYWCDGRVKRGSVYCVAHARPFVPGHRGRPPERVRRLRVWIDAALRVEALRLPLWIRRGRERYGLQP